MTRSTLGLGVLLAVAGGCDGGMPSTEIEVRSGGSIQRAVDQMKDGMTVRVYPGVYKESVNIAKERKLKNIKLVGVVMNGQRAVLEGDIDGTNKRQDGIFAAEVTGFTVEGF